MLSYEKIVSLGCTLSEVVNLTEGFETQLRDFESDITENFEYDTMMQEFHIDDFISLLHQVQDHQEKYERFKRKLVEGNNNEN